MGVDHCHLQEHFGPHCVHRVEHGDCLRFSGDPSMYIIPSSGLKYTNIAYPGPFESPWI